MDREKILAYSERTENLGEPEVFLGTGEVKEPGCGDQLNMYINTKREIITEFHYTVTDSACPGKTGDGSISDSGRGSV